MKNRVEPVGQPVRLTRRKVLLALAGTVCMGGFSAIGVGKILSNRTLRPPAIPIPRDYFGLHMHRADDGTPWPEVKFGSWRLWDAYVNWRHLEPQRGQWDFKRLDKYVAMAKLTGVDILLPLALTPDWASARPKEKSPYGPGNAAEPYNMEDWRNYVRTVAKRYKGRIQHFELWNEPNIPGFFSGSPERLVRLAEEAYRILKEIDPANQLAAPATVGGGEEHLAWLDRYLAAGGGKFMDVLSHHFYVAHTRPEATLPLVDKVRKIADKHGLSRLPLWNSEAGWWIDHSDGTVMKEEMVPGWKKLSAAEAAAYVSRALILGWAAGLERYYWYDWDGYSMGLIEPTTKAMKPAGLAYGRTLEWLLGSTMTECGVSDDVWICTLVRPDGGKARLVWQENGAVRNWRPPTEWGVKATETLGGVRQTMNDAQTKIQLESAPIYLS
jgi:hypothetical protein